MRTLGALLLCCSAFACTADGPANSYDFGPYKIDPNQEITKNCVQISLNNDQTIYVNSVELTTGPGFHHSNWFYVPDHVFPGPDGTYACSSRDFNEAAAAIFGGVLFAQSTQAPHEIQQFPPGVVIKIPRKFKIVTQIHLLNATDAPLTVRPNIKIGTIPEAEVVTKLAGISFQNQALALPARTHSRFSVDCDVDAEHRKVMPGRAPDFNIYYALAHYHELGTGLTIEAITEDNRATTVYSTKTQVGDTLGGLIEPAFNMTGYTRLRMSCDYYNPRTDIVKWGVGDQEMCVFLAFSDSPYNFGGGVNDEEEPLNGMQVGNAWHYSNPCLLFATEADRN